MIIIIAIFVFLLSFAVYYISVSDRPKYEKDILDNRMHSYVHRKAQLIEDVKNDFSLVYIDGTIFKIYINKDEESAVAEAQVIITGFKDNYLIGRVIK